MKKYLVKKCGEDFKFLEGNYNIKGSRIKKVVIDSDGNKAFFKYEDNKYNSSESCSEKMSYEIAKILGYECARIELARDNEGNLGILNYLFIDNGNVEHIDASAFLNIHGNQRREFYTISNIKRILDTLNKNLFKDFIKILFFDALVGEQDRHEENWGLLKNGFDYYMSPLYDNGCNLLREFKDEEFANKYYSNKKDFNAYIERSKAIIYNEANGKNYKHFELIEYLNKYYPNEIENEIVNLKKITDEKIEDIVNSIPDGLLTDMHKKYIIIYLKKRRDRLLSINQSR